MTRSQLPCRLRSHQDNSPGYHAQPAHLANQTYLIKAKLIIHDTGKFKLLYTHKRHSILRLLLLSVQNQSEFPPRSSHFWQIPPVPAPAKFLAGFPCLADFRSAAVHMDYLELILTKLVLVYHHQNDLTV